MIKQKGLKAPDTAAGNGTHSTALCSVRVLAAPSHLCTTIQDFSHEMQCSHLVVTPQSLGKSTGARHSLAHNT